MITEDYVSLETAELLKEKGFNEATYTYYLSDGSFYLSPMAVDNKNLYAHGHVSAPTLQMAVKWLRENKGIAIIPVLSSILDNEKFLWDIKIVVAKTCESYSQGWIYEKQEEAFNTAIKYCLESLI